MQQLNKIEALMFYNSGNWMKLTAFQLAGFQLYQSHIFCDFEVFHDALNECLHRGEKFGNEAIRFRLEDADKLKKDWEALYPVPDFAELKALLCE